MAGGEEINTPHTAEKEGEYQETRGGAGHWNDARAACWSLSVEGGAFVGQEPCLNRLGISATTLATNTSKFSMI